MRGTKSNGIHRRDFLRGLGCGLALSGGGWSALRAISPLSAADAQITPDIVRFRPEMEPVVGWIESTPRAKILDRAVEELRKGLGYRQLLGGTFLAGIRNIKPQPLGFKFHAVMVMSSAHQIGLDVPQGERLLPLFWALDTFKSSQEQDVKEGDWTLGAVNESAVPSPEAARKLFDEAMDRWDIEAADRAVAGLCRGAGAGEVMERLWPHGLREWRNIGHNIIFTAHAWRTLQTIGWEHAEPVLRSLVFGLLAGNRDNPSLQAFEKSQALAREVRPDWAAGKIDSGATADLLRTLRTASAEDAAKEAAALLSRGVAAESIWDAIIAAGCELLVKKPGILPLHAVTAANSLHFAFQASGRDSTRLLALLQAAAWIPYFREGTRSRGGDLPEGPKIDEIEPAAADAPQDPAAIFETMAKDRAQAARAILARAKDGRMPADFLAAARGLLLRKGNDSHDYKFACAAFEEAAHASPRWRPRLLAATAFLLRTPGDADSPLYERSRAALTALSGGGKWF